jgi:hypothetical protein
MDPQLSFLIPKPSQARGDFPPNPPHAGLSESTGGYGEVWEVDGGNRNIGIPARGVIYITSAVDSTGDHDRIGQSWRMFICGVRCSYFA